jgi:hypothetical protein
MGAATGIDGTYIINNIEPGTYTLNSIRYRISEKEDRKC